MSGECDECGQNALQCECMHMWKCSNCKRVYSDPAIDDIEDSGKQPCCWKKNGNLCGILLRHRKEYLREQFAKVLYKWNQKLWYGIDEDDRANLLADLLDSI